MKNKYEIRGDITAIILKFKDKTLETIIDTNDLNKADEYEWTWYPIFKPDHKKYYVRGASTPTLNKRVSFSLHTWLMGKIEKTEIDHINGDTLDNRRSCNLRRVTHAENLQNVNVRSDSKTGIKGVWWDKQQKKWTAEIVINYKRKRWFFKDIEDAKNKVLEERIKLHKFSQEATENNRGA